ncbi:hypothetical protein DFJ73DRAFT_821554 [Zopfochytrium polystomum]|nr:hypothetical protein DFJ73DRAFT_821554 [Zopfochytrium polystomum]
MVTMPLAGWQSSLADGDTASTAGQTDGVEEYSDDSALEPDDPAALDTSAAAAAAATSATTCSWEFHAVYSKVWGAPVLYFNCYDESGTVLPLRLSPSATETPVISQQDHPHLGLPFYYLHPCTTREFLDSLSANGEDDDEGDGDKSAGVAWRHLVLWLHAAAWALTAVVSCPVATLLASSSDNRWLRRWAAPPPRSTP